MTRQNMFLQNFTSHMDYTGWFLPAMMCLGRSWLECWEVGYSAMCSVCELIFQKSLLSSYSGLKIS
jgi:hypothetical protein